MRDGKTPSSGAVPWIISGVSVAATIAFFLLMTTSSAVLATPVVGRFGSRAIVVAFFMLAAMSVSVWLYGRFATAKEVRGDTEDRDS